MKEEDTSAYFSYWLLIVLIVVPRQKELLNVKSHILHQAWMMQLELLYVCFELLTWFWVIKT